MNKRILYGILLVITPLIMIHAQEAAYRLTIIREGDFSIAIDGFHRSPQGIIIPGSPDPATIEVDYPAGTEVTISILPPPPFIPMEFYSRIVSIEGPGETIAHGSMSLVMNEDITIRILYRTYPSSFDIPFDDFKEALLAVGDTDLNPGDKAVALRLERLGYNVSQVKADDLTTELVMTHDLLLLSSTGEGLTIPPDVLEYQIPKICWNQELYERLGIKRAGSSYETLGTSITDTLELTYEFNGFLHGVYSSSYVIEQITTEPAEIGWLDKNTSNINNAMLAFTEYFSGHNIASYKMETPGRRASLFFRDNTATLLTEKGWHFFDSLVSWAVPRIDVVVSPTECYVYNSEDIHTLTLDNIGMGCYWEITALNFDWLFPVYIDGKMNSHDNSTFAFHIDWSRFNPGETKVKNDVIVVFTNPVFGNELDREGISFIATNGDTMEPDPPGTVSYEAPEIIVAPHAPVDLRIFVDTGDQKLAAYGLEVTWPPNILSVINLKAGTDGFLSADSGMPVPGMDTVSGFDVSGKGPKPNLHLLTYIFQTVGTGTGTLDIDVNSLVDPNIFNIGIPSGRSSKITVVEKMRGDMNGDGIVDIVDALITAQHYTYVNKQSINLSAGDVNRDGSLDIIDALLIAQYFVGIIDEFPG